MIERKAITNWFDEFPAFLFFNKSFNHNSCAPVITTFKSCLQNPGPVLFRKYEGVINHIFEDAGND